MLCTWTCQHRSPMVCSMSPPPITNCKGKALFRDLCNRYILRALNKGGRLTALFLRFENKLTHVCTVSCIKYSQYCLVPCCYWSTDQCSTLRTITSQVITKTLCTLRLAWFYFTDACAHVTCVQRHASLVRVCGSYLWSASLPNEPMVRRELEGFIHMGSGVFCTSVLTSGSISEGEGVSFAPAMALRLRGCYFQRIRFPPLGVGRDRLIHRPTANAFSRVTGAVQRWRGRACFPAASRGSSDTLTANPFVRSRNPPSLIEKSWIGASLRFARRHDYTSTARPTGFTMRSYNRGQVFGF